MKSFIFCTSYFKKNLLQNNEKRYQRWLDFYVSNLSKIGCENLFLIDDGSPIISFSNEIAVLDPMNLPNKIVNQQNIIRFQDHLGRPSQKDYRGWWRSFTFSIILAEKYNFEKIVHIESDFFVVSDRMLEYINSISTGWISFYSPFFDFPESAIQVVTKDAFKLFKQVYLTLLQNQFSINISAERYLPFTEVEKSFNGDRFGEIDVLNEYLVTMKNCETIDWIGQVLPNFEVNDFDQFFKIENIWL